MFANLMRTAAPDPKDPNRIYKILQRDASTSAENEFLRFASILLQDRPEESLVHLDNILKMPKEELQMFSTEGGQPDGSTHYDSINYTKICTSIIRDLKSETLPASRRVSKKIHLVLRIYCWKHNIIL